MNRFALAAAVAVFALPASAQTNGVAFVNGVPTLDEVGLASLIALVAAVGGWLARRRK